jgi:hypothetical protein
VSDPAYGAYGLRLDGLHGVASLLVPADPGWPLLTIEHEVSDAELDVESLTVSRAELRLRTGGLLVVDRRSSTARFARPSPLSDEALVHPYLAPAAAVMAEWHGRLCVHAGAFVHGGRVWAVLGEREAGKSSTLAWLASNDHSVVTDDVLVLDGDAAFAGPRAIDLREEAAEELGVGRNLGRLGNRDRFRMVLPPIESVLPFGGWVVLDWSDRATVDPMPASELLQTILRQRVLRVAPAAPTAWLDLAGWRGWRFSRPRDWSALPAAVDVLFETLDRDDR